MREMMGDPKALVPQIFNGEQYCGVSQREGPRKGKTANHTGLRW